jgi:hypothetical protein
LQHGRGRAGERLLCRSALSIGTTAVDIIDPKSLFFALLACSRVGDVSFCPCCRDRAFEPMLSAFVALSFLAILIFFLKSKLFLDHYFLVGDVFMENHFRITSGDFAVASLYYFGDLFFFVLSAVCILNILI